MTQIITDTRALLRLFRQSGYGDLHLRVGHYELFIARPGGCANPLHQLQAGPDASLALAPAAVAEAAATEYLVVAPHLASLLSALPVGTDVIAGDAVARIELLGEPIDLFAEHAGIVAEVFVEPGALVEYAAPLLRLLAG